MQVKLLSLENFFRVHIAVKPTLIFIITLFLYSCTKEPQDIPSVSLSTDIYIENTDTVKPEFTVYRTDSFVTSSTSSVIVGSHNDPLFGKVTAKSFSRFTLPTFVEGTAKASNEYYDSLVLILHTDSSYYGDTMSLYTIQAAKITQDFDVNRKAYYNHNSITSSPLSLGSTTVRFRPNTDDSIRIKLSNDFGNELFNLFRSEDPKIKTDEAFYQYFMGLAINGSINNNVIYGFGTADTGVIMRLYYHEDQGYHVAKHIDFITAGGIYQFNQVECDVSGTALADLQPGEEINSTALDNRIFLNDLAGIGTKIRFPSISAFAIAPDFVRLSNATLQIVPIINSYETSPLPNAIAGQLSTEEKLGYSTLFGSDNKTAQDGDLYIDPVNKLNTRYSYDLTGLLRVEMYTTPLNSYTLELIPQTEINGQSFAFKRLVAADARHPTQPSILNCQLLFYKK